MPSKPKRPCSYPGCPNLCDGQYCKEHQKPMRALCAYATGRFDTKRYSYNKYERSPNINKKYGRAWTHYPLRGNARIRDRYAAAHPLCEMCLKEGRFTPVDEVHHIKPVSQGGTHDESNLMSLCRSCHTKIHCNELHDR